MSNKPLTLIIRTLDGRHIVKQTQVFLAPGIPQAKVNEAVDNIVATELMELADAEHGFSVVCAFASYKPVSLPWEKIIELIMDHELRTEENMDKILGYVEGTKQ